MNDQAYSSLGSILLALNMITEEQLQAALDIQQKSNRRLGEILIQRELITLDQFHEAMKAQEKLRGKNKYQRSMALADLAIQRHDRLEIKATRKRVQEQAEKITDEYPTQKFDVKNKND